MQIPFSDIKEDIEYLKIKQIDTRKVENLIINHVSLDYQKLISVPTQQYYTGAYTEETVHYITTKIGQRKKINIYW